MSLVLGLSVTLSYLNLTVQVLREMEAQRCGVTRKAQDLLEASESDFCGLGVGGLSTALPEGVTSTS